MPPALPLVLLLLAAWIPAALAQRDWQEVKCTRYAADWEEALARFGRAGLGAEFLDRHAAFIATGCRGRREVCPRSAAERRLADVMTIAAMNAGAASSFVPFACRE